MFSATYTYYPSPSKVDNMKRFTKVLIYNLLCVLQLTALAVGWIYILYIVEDVGAKIAWIFITTYFTYTADHPFFMSFKEPTP
jgi:hypothetical protein